MTGATWVLDAGSLLAPGWHAAKPDQAADTARRAFANALLKAMGQHRIRAVAVCFDSPDGVDRRRDRFHQYKQNHAHKPPAFWVNVVQPCMDITTALGAHVIQIQGWEADDLIATAVAQAPEDEPAIVLSKAPGLHQLLRLEGVQLYDGERFLTPADVEQIDGVPPHRLLELIALTGVKSDNVPGVPGVGPKTGAQLLDGVGLHELIQRASDPAWAPAIRNAAKIKAGIVDCATQLLLNLEILALDTTAPLPVTWEGLELLEQDQQELIDVFDRWGMKRLAQWIREQQDREYELDSADISAMGLNY